MSFSYDEISHYSDPSYNQALFNCSLHNSQHSELLLQRSTDNCHETCSDIHLHLPADFKSELDVDLKVLKRDLIKAAPTPEGVGNAPLCDEIAINTSLQSSQNDSSSLLLPEGNLVSLQGQVMAVHNLNHYSLDANSSNENCHVVQQLRFSRRVTWSMCIHVLTDHHIVIDSSAPHFIQYSNITCDTLTNDSINQVKIFGGLSEHAYPTGFGPGVIATFHRILELGYAILNLVFFFLCSNLPYIVLLLFNILRFDTTFTPYPFYIMMFG